jgi:hypothetical protein
VKIAVLGLLAAGVAVSLLLTQFVGHARVRTLRYADLTANVGTLELPRPVTRSFDERAGFEAFLRSRGARHVPAVDFARRRPVLVAAGARSTPAYEVRIAAVVEERSRIVVSVRMRSPTLARPGKARLSFPYRLLTLPAGTKPVHVEWIGL